MKRFKFITGAVLATCLLLTPVVSWACSWPVNSPHQLDPSEVDVDQEPPSKVSVVNVLSERPNNFDGYCWGLGSVALTIAPATDDRTDSEHMGYMLNGVSDSWPEGFGFDDNGDTGPVRAFVEIDTSETLHLYWSDIDDDGSQDIDFVFSISAVDLAGNQGSPSDPVHIYHPGSSSGCSTNGFGDLLPAVLLMFTVMQRFRKLQRHSNR